MKYLKNILFIGLVILSQSAQTMQMNYQDQMESKKPEEKVIDVMLSNQSRKLISFSGWTKHDGMRSYRLNPFTDIKEVIVLDFATPVIGTEQGFYQIYCASIPKSSIELVKEEAVEESNGHWNRNFIPLQSFPYTSYMKLLALVKADGAVELLERKQ